MDLGADASCRTARNLASFHRMGERDLRALLRLGRHAVYRRQRALCYQSEPARDVFLILSGRAARMKYRADESCVILGRAEGGDWIGLPEVLLGATYLADAVAEEKTEAVLYSARALGEAMKIPPVKDHCLEYLARSLFLLHSQVELNLPLPRIVRHVLDHARAESSGSAFLAATQEDIARAVGVTRETVNKHLQSLQAEGLLKIGRGRIELLDREALDEKTLL